MHAQSTSGAPARGGLSEDLAATLLGIVLVAVALAATWLGRPTGVAAEAEFPKGWPTPLATLIDKPQTWGDSPREALFDKRGRSLAGPRSPAGGRRGSFPAPWCSGSWRGWPICSPRRR
jgi:hypothetical protein